MEELFTGYYGAMSTYVDVERFICISRSNPVGDKAETFYTREIFLSGYTNQVLVSNDEFHARTGRCVILEDIKKDKFSKVLLAPTAKIFNEWKDNKNKEQYIKDYNSDVLGKLDPVRVLNAIKSKRTVMLCYESIGDFCHRNLAAKWFKEANVECRELR